MIRVGDFLNMQTARLSYWVYTVCCICMLLLSQVTKADSSNSLVLQQLRDTDSSVAIWPYADYVRLSDAQTLSFKKIVDAPELLANFIDDELEFSPLTPEFLNQGLTDQGVLIKATFTNNSNQPTPWVMVAETSYIDTMKVYQRTPDGLVLVKALSDEVLFKFRDIEYRKLNVQSSTPAFSSAEYYIYSQMSQRDSLSINYHLWHPDVFKGYVSNEQFLFGIYFGVCLALIIVCSLLALSLRKRIYFSYLWYLIFNTLMWACLSGHAFQYLWPQSPDIHNNSYHLMYLFFVFFAIQFSQDFLGTKNTGKNLYRCLRVAQALVLVAVMMRLFGVYEWVLYIAFAAILALMLLPWVGWQCYQAGIRYARWYIFAWNLYSIGLLLSVLSATGVISSWGMEPLYYTQVASLLESLALTMAIADKVLQLNNKYEVASRQSLHDELTGLGNRRMLKERFTERLSNIRQGESLWLVMLDIDHFKKINDRYGHQAGDKVLKKLADVLTHHSRPDDLVVRYGGEEFVLMIDADNQELIEAIAERIREYFETSPTLYQQYELSHSVSLGISNIELTEEDALEKAIYRADKALYQSKSKGRNQVTCFAAKVAIN